MKEQLNWHTRPHYFPVRQQCPRTGTWESVILCEPHLGRISQTIFFLFSFWSIHICVTVKDFGFCIYVSIHISLHHKLLSLLLTQYQPCTSYEYLIGVKNVFCYFALVRDIIICVLNRKWIQSDLVLCLSDKTWKERCKLGWFQISWSLRTKCYGNVSELVSTC